MGRTRAPYPMEFREQLIALVRAGRSPDALADNDILACAFARLLLWTLPDALPGRDDAVVGWSQYRRTWRPGTPHPEPWAGHWKPAWELLP